MMLIIIIIIVLAASLVAISIGLTSKILTEEAAAQMNLFCEERGDDLDTELLRIEDAVGSLSRWTKSKIPSVETITEDSELRDAIVNDADDLIRYMTEENDFVQGAYIHYTLDITGVTNREEGVYYTRDVNGKFKIIPFAQEEIVSDPVADYWYYGPIENKKALWTDPYFDYSVEEYLISYIEPIFIDDVPVAIIGIDISFTRLLEWVDSLKYHETGYMFLKEADGSVHYHFEDLEYEHQHSDDEDMIIENGELMLQPSTGEELIRYYYEGRDRVMAFVTLRNGMKFVLCDGYDNIFKERDNATILMISITVGIAIVFAIIAAYMASRVTDPLRKLTAAANEISEGDYDVILPPEKNNEIGELSRAFRIAIDNIRARREEIEAVVRAQDRKIVKNVKTIKQQEDDLVVMKNLAYVDPLTNVKSKHAYEDTVKYIDEQIKNGTAEFAVVMCDLNYLKHINDNLGHKAGDEAIRKAAYMLCKVFPMSTVFRIGGDEFVVIPSVLEYAKIDEKQNLLKAMINEQNNVSDNYLERISIAFGCAVFDRNIDHSYQEVFDRADKIMYEDKKKIHEKDGISTDR
jgi:diguanylate cyclase (GGDEF)-like protein